MTDVETIIEGIFTFKIIPFFGAGMSRDLGLKTWGEIIEDLRAALGNDETDYLQVAELYEHRFGRDALIDLLKKNYDRPIDPTKLDLHNLILSMEPSIIYTTNYDSAIEFAAQELGRSYEKVAGLRDISRLPHHAKQIIKFHGDFSAPENIVFTRSDYDKRMAGEHALDIQFRANLLGKGLLFLGYSFRDENIDTIFKKHANLYDITLWPKSYLVAFDQDPDKEAELARQNIVTIHLKDPNELKAMIQTINEKVFSRDMDTQFDELLGNIPLIALLATDLDNLRKYMADLKHSTDDKVSKLRSSLEFRVMSKAVEADVVGFLNGLIDDPMMPEPIKEAIVAAYPHMHIQEMLNIFNLSYKMIDLTAYKSMNHDGPDVVFHDVLSTIEAKFRPKAMVYMLFLYLQEAMENGRVLTKLQLRRIFDMLRICDYAHIPWEKLADFPEANRQTILRHFLTSDRDLEQILNRKSFIPRRPFSQIMDQIMSAMPDSLGKGKI